jgi:hypothetical protein
MRICLICLQLEQIRGARLRAPKATSGLDNCKASWAVNTITAILQSSETVKIP